LAFPERAKLYRDVDKGILMIGEYTAIIEGGGQPEGDQPTAIYDMRKRLSDVRIQRRSHAGLYL
jgi:hypothetical protein